MQLIESIGYDTSFSFIFSPRPGTPAAEIKDDTPQSVKLMRLQRLQKRVEEIAREISANMVGSIQKVLVEGKSKRHSYELTLDVQRNFKTVNFAGNERLTNQIIEVRITGALANSLRGEIITKE